MASRYTVHPEHLPCTTLALPSSMMAIREYWFSFRCLMMQILCSVLVSFLLVIYFATIGLLPVD